MIAKLVLLTFSYSICKTCCHHHRWRSIYMCPLFFFLSSLSSLYTNLTLTGLSIVNISRSTMWALIWTQSIDTFVLSGTIVFSWYAFINIYTEFKKKINAKNSPGWDTSSNFMKVALCICVLFFLLLFLPVLFTSFKPRFFCLFSCLFSVMLHEQFFGNYSCLTLL